jgi:hypothetical protein
MSTAVVWLQLPNGFRRVTMMSMSHREGGSSVLNCNYRARIISCTPSAHTPYLYYHSMLLLRLFSHVTPPPSHLYSQPGQRVGNSPRTFAILSSWVCLIAHQMAASIPCAVFVRIAIYEPRASQPLHPLPPGDCHPNAYLLVSSVRSPTRIYLCRTRFCLAENQLPNKLSHLTNFGTGIYLSDWTDLTEGH